MDKNDVQSAECPQKKNTERPGSPKYKLSIWIYDECFACHLAIKFINGLNRSIFAVFFFFLFAWFGLIRLWRCCFYMRQFLFNTSNFSFWNDKENHPFYRSWDKPVRLSLFSNVILYDKFTEHLARVIVACIRCVCLPIIVFNRRSEEAQRNHINIYLRVYTKCCHSCFDFEKNINLSYLALKRKWDRFS